MISVKVQGIKRLVSNLKGLEDGRIYNETISEVADCTLTRAMQLVPVDTGKLKASIKKEKHSESSYSVTAHAENKQGVDYAQFVEYGCRTIFKPFLRPAQHECVDKAGTIFGNKLRKQWK